MKNSIFKNLFFAVFFCVCFVFQSADYRKTTKNPTFAYELFFDIPTNSSKFEIQSALDLDKNFFYDQYTERGYKDLCNCISANFRSNIFLSTNSAKDAHIVFWFDKVTNKSNSRKITLEYDPLNFDACLEDYNSICKIFQAESHGSGDSEVFNYDHSEKIGKGRIYSYSPKATEANDEYIKVNYSYTDMTKRGGKSFYQLEITFYEDAVY